MNKKLVIALLVGIVGVLFAEELKRERHDIPYKGEKELDVSISFGLGRLNLQGYPELDYILRSEMVYAIEQFKPIVTYKVLGNRGRLRLESKKNGQEKLSHKDDKKWSGDKNVWNLEFSTRVPATYDIEMGLGEGNLNFTKIPVQDLRLQCGLSDVKMRFEENNPENMKALDVSTGLGNVEVRGLGNANMERFDVECGLGNTELIFNGKLTREARGKIRVGLGSVTIKMPDNIAVEVRAESSFLSSLDLRGFERVGEKNYRSGNWRSAKQRIYMDIEVGLGSVAFIWLD